MNQRVLPIWQPLSEWRFRALWIASIGSNCGSWIYTITVQWQVTSISTSPLSISMVLVAANLPQFLFLLPAGVLCDLVDRRRLLIASQMALAVSPLLLGAALLVGYDWLGVLLAATFVIGVATAFSSTALQTIVPEIVPREQLLSAVALNSVSINVSRSVGPAIGGAVVAASGALAGFVVSAISGLGTYLVALRLPAVKRAHSASMAQLVRSMKEGLNFVYSTPRLRAILIRETTFVFFASILWALVPALVRLEFGMGAGGYGMLMACVGLGALASAIIVPVMQERFSGNQLALPATICFACCCILPAAVDRPVVVWTALFLGGMGWTAMLVIFNTAMQVLAPEWLRGRALSAQGVVLFGTLGIGGMIWGFLADHVGVKATFLISGFGLLATLVLHCRYALTIHADDTVSHA